IFAALAAIAVIAFTAPGRAEAACCNPWDSNGGIVEHQDGVSWTDFVWPAKSARDADVAGRDNADRWNNAAKFRNTALFGEGDDRWDAGADNTHWGSVGTDGSGEISVVPADGVSWT
ncbi:MAG TPA: hypothetical protein VGF17_23580, partial [Phytomonospora sp.]